MVMDIFLLGAHQVLQTHSEVVGLVHLIINTGNQLWFNHMIGYSLKLNQVVQPLNTFSGLIPWLFVIQLMCHTHVMTQDMNVGRPHQHITILIQVWQEVQPHHPALALCTEIDMIPVLKIHHHTTHIGTVAGSFGHQVKFIMNQKWLYHVIGMFPEINPEVQPLIDHIFMSIIHPTRFNLRPGNLHL